MGASEQATPSSDDGKNPYSSAIDIINQANAAFIASGVKFVIAVGDLADSGTSTTPITNSGWYPSLNAALVQENCAASTLCSASGAFASGAKYNGGPTWSVGMAGETARAIFAQSLYNAGIGFYPVRGNHDDSRATAGWFQYLYPQTQTGMNNTTPADAYTLPNPDSATLTFPTKTGSPFQVGTITPSTYGLSDLLGMSYAFNYNNAAFVLVDQFTTLDGVETSNAGGGAQIDDQQPWINDVLSKKPANGHAFVFSHKGLITEDHTDVLFGSDPSKDSTGTNAFINSLIENGVGYYIGGHDHMHLREVVTTTDNATNDPTKGIHELVCASNSNKYYTPSGTPNDNYNIAAFGHSRQTLLSGEEYYIPYYIVTVDGPKSHLRLLWGQLERERQQYTDDAHPHRQLAEARDFRIQPQR